MDSKDTRITNLMQAIDALESQNTILETKKAIVNYGA